MAGVDDSLPDRSQLLKDGQGNPPSKTLWVWNLPDYLSDLAIRDIFTDFGSVENITRSVSAKRRIDTFVTFRDIDSAMKVVSYCQTREFTQFGQRVTIRFSRLREHAEPQRFSRGYSKVTNARSEWFQTSPAPRATLAEAKQVLSSPTAPRSMRLNASPPPVRRSEPRKPETRFCREPHVDDDQDWRARIDHLYYDRSVDRYVPEHRTRGRDDVDRDSPEPYRRSYRRYRSRSRSRSSSRSPAYRARRVRSPTPVAYRSETVRKTEDDEPQNMRDTVTTPLSVPQKSSTSREATNSVDVKGTATINKIATPAPEYDATSANDKRTDPLSVHLQLNESRPSVPLICLSKAKAFEIIDATNAANSSKGASLLVGEAVANLSHAAAMMSPSSVQHLRAPNDDTSSTTSSSSKASQKRRLCTHCKESESSISGTFTVCHSCSRRYHARCGDPSPTSTAQGEAFLCGHCRRKPPAMNERNVLIRAASPELRTEKQDQLLRHPPLAQSEQVRTASTPVLQSHSSIHPHSSNVLIQKKPDQSRALHVDDDKHHNSTPPRVVQAKDPASHGFATTQTELQIQAQHMAHLYKGVTCPASRLRLECSFHERCMFAHHDTGIYAPRIGQTNRRFTCFFWKQKLPCEYSYPCPYAHQDTGFYIGRDQKASTKHITCSFWRTNGFCKLSEDECLFTHQDTGIHAPAKSNPAHQNLSTSSSLRSVTFQTLSHTPATTSRQSQQSRTGRFQTRDNTPNHKESSSTREDSGLVGHIKVDEMPATTKALTPSLQAFNSALLDRATRVLTPERIALGNIRINQSDGTSSSPAASFRRGSEDPTRGDNTSFALTAHRDDNGFVHGADTPFSPASSIMETEVAMPTKTKVTKATGCGPTPTSVNKEASLRNLTKSPTVPIPDLQVDKISQTSPTKSLTSRSPDTATAPRKHFAKRTARDPRLLKLAQAAQASKAAQTTISSDIREITESELATTTIKKCEKCQKRILGSTNLCVGCSEVNESEKIDRVPKENPPVGVSTTDKHSGDSNLIMQILSADILTAEAKEARAENEGPIKASARASSTCSTSDGVASLKRPSQDNPFIQRKRSRIEIPIKSAHSPLGWNEGPLHVKTQFQKNQGSLKKATSLEELTRLAREAKGLMLGSDASKSSESSVRNQQKQADDREPRPALLTSKQEIAEEQTASIQRANTSASEVESTKRKRRSTSPSLPDNNTVAAPSRGLRTSREDSKASKAKNENAQSDSTSTRIVLIINNGKQRPKRCRSCARAHRKCLHNVPVQHQIWKSCDPCHRLHKKCLHNSTGELDPSRCAAFLNDHQDNQGRASLSSVNVASLAMIKAAAARLDISVERDTEIEDKSNEEYDEDADHQKVRAPASPSSSDEPLGAIVNSSGPKLRLRLHHGVGGPTTKPSIPITMDMPSSINTSILTPAHTPSPMAAVATVSTENSNMGKSSQQAKVMEKLHARGVQFESDDSDLDEEMGDAKPATSHFDSTALWPKKSSLDLFDVAPLLRPSPSSTAANSTPKSNQRTGLSKKQLWKNLLRIQTTERRSQFGNPHQIVSRDLPSQTVTTTIAQDLPITEEERLRFTIPEVENKKVQMPFERFLKMPVDPIVVRVGEGRDKNGLWDVELAWRDGRKENLVTNGGRRVRADGERWPFARG